MFVLFNISRNIVYIYTRRQELAFSKSVYKKIIKQFKLFIDKERKEYKKTGAQAILLEGDANKKSLNS